MMFRNGDLWHRDRRKPVADRYNPAKQVPGDWGDGVDTVELGSCSFDSGASSDIGDAARTSVETIGTLHCPPGSDIRVGDRVWCDTDPGVFFYVNRRPASDKNPFTGWRPVMQVPLDLTEG